MVPCWHSSIQVYYGLAEFPLLTPKQHRVMVPCWSLCWVSLECLLIWWKISNVYFNFHFSGLFSTKTFKQHRVMVPCWPLCWASLAPAAQHESDNQGIVHLTPSFSTFSHRGCIIVFCIVHLTPNSSFFSHHGALNPKISESSETFQVSHKSVLGHPFPISLLFGFSPHKIWSKRQEDDFETFSILNVSQSNPHELLES